jgi:Ca2+-dependent lipid-binding protein
VASRAESTWHDAEVLVVTLVEASNLIVRDFIMKKSDPFCKLKLGKLSRKSSVKSGNLNPIWNEVRSWKCLIPRRVI